MLQDMAYFLAGVASAWLITYIYYKKSLKQQGYAAQSQIRILNDILYSQNITSDAVIKQKRIEECIAEYRRAGTPVRVLDSYNDMSNKDKAEMFDTVILRIKGRKPKHNKYRT